MGTSDAEAGPALSPPPPSVVVAQAASAAEERAASITRIDSFPWSQEDWTIPVRMDSVRTGFRMHAGSLRFARSFGLAKQVVADIVVGQRV